MHFIYLAGLAIQFKSIVMSILAFIYGVDAIIGLLILINIFSNKNNIDE